jgi:hypothetical protein
MKDHKDLDVWKKSIDLVVESYRFSGKFPKDELFGLTSQMRRAAVSIPSNIAEGAARNTLETQFVIANKLGYLDVIDDVLVRLAAVQQMLNGLIRHYRNKGPSGVR